MGKPRRAMDRFTDFVADKLSDLLGALAPEPDAVPIPVRDRDPRGPRR